MNECKIVQDLLPLYAEDLISPETKEFVDTHCSGCTGCERLRQHTCTPMPEQPENPKAYKKALQRQIIRTSLKGSVYALLVVIVIAMVFAIGVSPQEEPVVYESPDGIHSLQFRYWGGVFGLMEGMEIKDVWRNGWSQGGHHPWKKVLDVVWSPDGTCAFVTMEMLNGQTGMYISMNQYTEDVSRSWWYPGPKGGNHRNLGDVLSEMCKAEPDFSDGWENIRFTFVSWADENKTVTLAYETDNAQTGTLDFNVVTEMILKVN